MVCFLLGCQIPEIPGEIKAVGCDKNRNSATSKLMCRETPEEDPGLE